MERTEIHKILDMVLDIGSSSKHSVKVSYTGAYFSETYKVEPYIDITVFEYDGEKVAIKAQKNFVREFDKDLQAFLLAWKAIIMRERVEYDIN